LIVWKEELEREGNKLRFVTCVVEKKLKLELYEEDEELHEALEKFKFLKIEGKFDYLLNMQIRSLTKKKIEELTREIAKITFRIDELKSKNPIRLWLDDLATFKTAYTKFLKTRREE
jgi:hypothetical protein